jgi:hypothetical protein
MRAFVSPDNNVVMSDRGEIAGTVGILPARADIDLQSRVTASPCVFQTVASGFSGTSVTADGTSSEQKVVFPY